VRLAAATADRELCLATPAHCIEQVEHHIALPGDRCAVDGADLIA